MIIWIATTAMQQDDDWTFLPMRCASVQSSINRVVLRRTTRSRRWKSKMLRIIKLNPCCRACGRN